MKCKHGVLGQCSQCTGEWRDAQLLEALARLVQQLAELHKLDTSKLRSLVRY